MGVVGATPVDVDLILQAEQMRHPEVMKVRDLLEQCDVLGFELIDGVVYKINKSSGLRLYAPASMEDQLIRLEHAMRSKVEKFIRNCLPCILHSVPKTIHNRTLHSIPKPSVPFHTLHIDHLGPLPSIN